MDQAGTRVLIGQLAEDLGWLEEHCRRQPDQAVKAAQLRLATSLVRNCLGPFLDGQPATPLHVAVVGGAGTGKSTVANFLSGAVAAEANPQAGFTRHPVAYAGSNGALGWTGHLGFLGLEARDEPAQGPLLVVGQLDTVAEGEVVHDLTLTWWLDDPLPLSAVLVRHGPSPFLCCSSRRPGTDMVTAGSLSPAVRLALGRADCTTRMTTRRSLKRPATGIPAPSQRSTSATWSR